MLLIVLFLLALLLFGAGFAIHLLWILAVVAVIAFLAQLFDRGPRF